MSRRADAISDDPVVEQAAQAALLDGASALGAVAAGFLTAAAQRPAVLLAPVTLLVAAVGLGARAFDGRHRQPGLGGKRPRGFVEGQPIPVAARIAAPASVSALLVALAYDQASRLSGLIGPATRLARAAGAGRRADVFERLGAVGPRALAEPMILAPLLAVGGPPEGGALTAKDLEGTRAVDHPAAEAQDDGGTRLSAPWRADLQDVAGANTRAVCAMDAQGTAVALCYYEARDGVDVPELELSLLACAEPVMRGVTRVPPGTPLPAPTPLAMWLRDGDPVRVAATVARGGTSIELLRDERSRVVRPVRGDAR